MILCFQCLMNSISASSLSLSCFNVHLEMQCANHLHRVVIRNNGNNNNNNYNDNNNNTMHLNVVIFYIYIYIYN